MSGLMYDSRVGSDDARVGVGDEDAAELVVVAHEHAVEELLGASEGVVHGARVDPELEHRGLGDHRAGGGGRRPGVGGGCHWRRWVVTRGGFVRRGWCAPGAGAGVVKRPRRWRGDASRGPPRTLRAVAGVSSRGAGVRRETNFANPSLGVLTHILKAKSVISRSK